MAFRSISIKALAIAIGVGFVASAVIGFVPIFVLAAFYGFTSADIQALLATSIPAIAGVYACNVALYLGVGYLAAVIAKRAELLHGALSSALFVLAGLYGLASGVAPEFQMRNLVLTILAPFLGLLGGWLHRQRVRAAINAKSA